MAAGLDPSPNTQGNHAWVATNTEHLIYNTFPGGGDTAALVNVGLKTGSITAASDTANVTTVVAAASGTYVGIDDFRHAGPPKSGMSIADQLARQWPLGV